FDLAVAPGADPGRIHLAIEGARSVALAPEGDLLIRTEDGGEIPLRPPVAWVEEAGGRRRPVEVAYSLDARGARLEVRGERADEEALVIDPVLLFGTYLGGDADDRVYALAVDSLGNAYVGGSTDSTNFPTT